MLMTFAVVPACALSSASGISTAMKLGLDNVDDDGRTTSTSGDVVGGPPYFFRSAAVQTSTSDWNWRAVERRLVGGVRCVRPSLEAAEVLNRDRRLGHRDCLPAPRMVDEDVTSSRRTFFSRSKRRCPHSVMSSFCHW